MESYTMTIVLKILFINACFLWNYMETTFSPSPYQFDYNHAGNGVYCFKYAVRSIPRRMRIPYDNGQTKRYVWRTRYRKVGLMLGTCCPGTYGKRCQHSCFDCQRFKKIEEKLTLMEGNVTMMSDQSAATETCAPGTKGPMGYEGAKGYKGQKGEPGLQGSPGAEGRPGRRGPQGPQGPPGKPGLPGQDGQPGKDGNTGQRGQKGVPGFDGPKGERGERGRPGSPGLPGGKGVPGEPGKSPLSLTDIGAIKKKIELIQSLPNSKGVPGDPGRKGSRGLQGPKGQKGDNGSSGYTGKKGERGQKGEMGLIGLRGDKGEKGIQGLPGINGQKGLPGFPGLEGIKGSPGKSGRNGIKGDKGLPGDKGAKGDIAAFPFSASEILDLKNRIKKLEEMMKMCGDLLVKSITNSSSSTMKTSEETTTPALSSTEQIAFYKTLSTEEINGSGEAADLTFVLPTPASLDTDVYNCENTEDVTDLKNFDWMSDPPPLPPWKKNVILSELKKRNSNCTKSCLTYAIYFYENTS